MRGGGRMDVNMKIRMKRDYWICVRLSDFFVRISGESLVFVPFSFPWGIPRGGGL